MGAIEFLQWEAAIGGLFVIIILARVALAVWLE